VLIQALLSLTIALASSAGPPRVQSGTGGCFAAVYPQIDSARSREDSLALGERLLKGHPGGQTCGNFVAGYLFGVASTAREDDWRLRQRAMELLNAGLRGNESDPRLYFAHGVLLYNRNSRTDAERMFARAVDRMTPREEAHIHYIRGMMHQDLWRDYRSFGDIKTTFGGQFHCGRMQDDQFTSFFFFCPDEFDDIMLLAFTPLRDLRKKEYEKMEDAFRAALRADPAHEEAQRRLFEEYLYAPQNQKP
jgi:tetratricopeptide (TPR) repeat protein